MADTANIRKAQTFAKDLPWNCFTAEDLGPAIMNFCGEHEPFFRRWAEVWFQNFQFIYGNQNIKWSRRHGFAVDYDFFTRATNNNFAFSVQTNIARVIAESLSALLYANLPTWETQAMDESSLRGKRFEKIIGKFLDCYMQRLLMDKEFTAGALIFATFGQVAADVDWRYNLGRMVSLPKLQKAMREVFSSYMAPNPATGGLLEVPTPVQNQFMEPIQEEVWEPMLDSAGRQIVDKIFAGDAGVDMMTPLEYRREPGTYGMHKTRWIQRFKLLDYDQFLDEYGTMPGRHEKNFANIRPVYHDETIFSFAVRHFMRMQFVTSPTLGDEYRERSMFRTQSFRYKVFVVEHYDRPHPVKWPFGRKVVVANGQATHITKPTYSTGKMDGWHPFVEAQWMAIPPSSISSGPLNDTIRKNKEVNVKDSLIATAVRRNMGSTLLIKNGVINPQALTGEPGMTHEVSDINGMRWLHDDMPIPPVISRLREMDKEDIYESSGAIEALRGMPSSGATSGYQEKQREEREEKRLSPAKKGFESFASGIGEKLFCCVKANAREKLAPDVMAYLKRSAAGEFTTQDVIALMTSTIDFGTDVKIVKSSMAIRSKATQQATLQELAAGVLNGRLTNDAKVLDKYLKFFDAETFRDGSAAHRDRAGRENEAFLDFMRLGPAAAGVKSPIVLLEDDDDIHISEHDEFIVQNFDDLRNNEWLLQMIYAHKEWHRLQKQEKLGELPPGTALQTGTMMQDSSRIAKPTVATIYQLSQQQRMQKMQSGQGAPAPAEAPGATGASQQAESGSGGTPGPTNPSAQGAPKGRTMAPGTPSNQTAAGARQSVISRGGAR